jgi:DNA polymerase V
MPIFALVDANNFYASCEKLFDPMLAGKPVVVLSNNDGVVVARSAEARALGVPMGTPWHKLRDQAKRDGIIAFSSNYALYADMSDRVVELLSHFSPDIEVYSIDESFLELSGFAELYSGRLAEYGQEIRQRVARWLGLAVCVGIGATKTQAKLANHAAKKALAGRDGVCDFTVMSEQDLSDLFAKIEVGEVWGVGRKISARLEEMNIRTVRDLRDADSETLRSKFSVVLERTIQELRGVSCLDLEEVAPAKQQIMSSRSFGQYVYDLPALQEAVATYIAKAAEKLRAQQSVAGAVQVYVRTSPFNPKEPQYQKSVTVPLPEHTADTRELTGYALGILANIYRPGFAYQKAGVMLSELQPKHVRQGSLFTDSEGEARSGTLMSTIDSINRKFGRGAMQLLAAGTGKSWQMRRGNLSPSYTTSWEELPTAIAK